MSRRNHPKKTPPFHPRSNRTVKKSKRRSGSNIVAENLAASSQPDSDGSFYLSPASGDEQTMSNVLTADSEEKQSGDTTKRFSGSSDPNATSFSISRKGSRNTEPSRNPSRSSPRRSLTAPRSAASAPGPLTTLSMLQNNAPDGPALNIDDNRIYLVLGGSSFLGRHIVEDYLLRQGKKTRVMDIVQTFTDNRLDLFYVGDIRNRSDIDQVMRGVDTVFHCASLTDPWARPGDYQSVNVQGTQNVLDACLQHNVRRLIYASSISVVFRGADIQNGTEASCKYPTQYVDEFARSKATAERMVLSANGKKLGKDHGGELLTCAIRPHGMFGERDTSFVANLISRARKGEITHMIGEGHNVVDFTYVANVVYAYALASEKLERGSKIGGQAYFITNGEPTLFWEFVSQILNAVGCPIPHRHISFSVAYALAWFMELFYWMFGWFLYGKWRPSITRRMVSQMACHHWFSHEKATQELGYYPIVSLQDGIQRTIKYFASNTRPAKDINENYVTIPHDPD